MMHGSMHVNFFENANYSIVTERRPVVVRADQWLGRTGRGRRKSEKLQRCKKEFGSMIDRFIILNIVMVCFMENVSELIV